MRPAELHLWQAPDRSRAERGSGADSPVRSGAESFLAGTASCRIQVGGTEELAGLWSTYAAADLLHPVSRAGAEETDFGTREFHTLDVDGNLLAFSVRLAD